MEIFQITLFDIRVKGKLLNPARPPYHFEVGAKDKLDAVLNKIATTVGKDTIRLLSLYAHGFVAKDHQGKTHGGFGIQFASGIFQNTVAAFKVLNGKFTSQVGIELVGCAVGTQDGYRDPSDNATSAGQDLCWALARATGTGVRASSDDQQFAYGPLAGKDGGQEYVDPGAWEGAVWIFKPNGTVEQDTHYSR